VFAQQPPSSKFVDTYKRSSAAAAFLLLAGSALAQPPDWYAHREERFRGEEWRAHLFAEIREDLDHAQATTFGGRDEFRLARTKQKLNQLEVIATMQKLAADSRISPRDNEILNDDLQRLRARSCRTCFSLSMRAKLAAGAQCSHVSKVASAALRRFKDGGNGGFYWAGLRGWIRRDGALSSL
jgi:hypothetical protein